MSRIIVETIEDMPGEARDGLPLGCVLETDGPTVLACGLGSTWSAEGLKLRATGTRTYTATFASDPDSGDGDEPVEVRAVDLKAALQWLARHFHGPFELYVDPAPVYLGEFE